MNYEKPPASNQFTEPEERSFRRRNNIVTTILENSEDLDLSKDQLEKIQGLVNDCTSKTVSVTLNQLINLY